MYIFIKTGKYNKITADIMWPGMTLQLDTKIW